MRIQGLIAVLALAGAASCPALAQSVDQTGTGGGPDAAITAPYTTVTGETVPRPGTLRSGESGRIERRTREETLEDTITTGICIGCSR